MMNKDTLIEDLEEARSMAYRLQDALGTRNAPVASADTVVLANQLGNLIGATIEELRRGDP